MRKNDRILIKNTIAQYVKTILSTLGTLIYTRIVFQQLGASDYGIFSVIAGFIALFGVLNNSMIVAVQRFISYEIAVNNYLKINKIYNTCINIHILIALIVLLIGETVGIFFVKNYMVFEPGKIDDAIFVFHCVILSFVVNVISIPQQAVLIAYEKIFLSAIVGLIDTALKVAGAFFLCVFTDEKLKVYSVIFVVISVIIRFFYSLIVKVHVKELSYRITFDKPIYKEIIGFAGWNLLGGISNIGKIQGVNILLNLFYGTLVNASYGIANQINSQMLIFSSGIFQASNSQIVQAYRKKDNNRLIYLVTKTSKFAFILYFSFSIIVFSLADELLNLWLGNVPVYCSIFVQLMILNSCIELFSTPLMTITQASGKIKLYFIVISIIMLLILPISYLLLKLGAYPYIVILVTIFINMLLLNVRGKFVKDISAFDVSIFYRDVVFRCFFVIVISIGFVYFLSLYENVLLLKCVFSVIVLPIVVIVSSYYLLLNRDEKFYIVEYAKKIIRNR